MHFHTHIWCSLFLSGPPPPLLLSSLLLLLAWFLFLFSVFLFFLCFCLCVVASVCFLLLSLFFFSLFLLFACSGRGCTLCLIAAACPFRFRSACARVWHDHEHRCAHGAVFCLNSRICASLDVRRMVATFCVEVDSWAKVAYTWQHNSTQWMAWPPFEVSNFVVRFSSDVNSAAAFSSSARLLFIQISYARVCN